MLLRKRIEVMTSQKIELVMLLFRKNNVKKWPLGKGQPVSANWLGDIISSVVLQ